MDPIAAVLVIKKVWDAWDVRVMILLSLFLQIILFTLGNRRKYTVKAWLGSLLWVAYLSADWVATAALGKLSSTCREDYGPTDILRGLWASLLLLHLGGPDTITAIALEDNLLWKRHLFGLVFQAALAIYVIVLSWTRSWLSLLNFPLFLAGIIKYSERTWSLYSATSKDWRRSPPLFDAKILESVDTHYQQNPESVTDAKKIVLAHQWFAIERPYMKNYFSTAGNLKSLGAKLAAHWRDIITDDRSEDHFRSLANKSPILCMFDIAAIELGFMFDMLYTKAAIVYTKLGWILRLISFFCSSFVLFSFLKSFSSGKPNEQYSSKVDIYITGILLAGAVALEFYSLFVIISSDWFELLRIRYRRNCLLSGIFQVASLLKQQKKKKRWSGSMGQFNLLRYCISFRKQTGIKILQMIGIDEMLLKHWNTSFRDIPSSLKQPASFPPKPPMGWFNMRSFSSEFTRGETTLMRCGCADETVMDTVRMDLDETIMIWHVATDICYPHPVSPTTDERIRICKVISDYMMYLLVTKPSMVSQDENFWFDSFSRELRESLQQNKISLIDETTVYSQFWNQVWPAEFNGTPFKDIITHAFRIMEFLRPRPEKWDIMMSVWLEIMDYAAIYCPHASHLQELTHGGEFLSLHWLLQTYNYHDHAAEHMNWRHEIHRRQAEASWWQWLRNP